MKIEKRGNRYTVEDGGKRHTVTDFAMGMYDVTGLFRGQILDWDLVDAGFRGHLGDGGFSGKFFVYFLFQLYHV